MFQPKLECTFTSCHGFQNGALFAGVINITGHSADLTYGELVPTKCPVILCHSDLPFGRISVYDYLVHSDDSLTFLTSTGSS